VVVNGTFPIRTAVGKVSHILRSVQHPGGRVNMHYRSDQLEISVVEVAGHSSLVDPGLCARASWHLVLDGHAVFHIGHTRWELLPDESLTLPADSPYTIVNPSPSRLRILSVLSEPGPAGPEGRR